MTGAADPARGPIRELAVRLQEVRLRAGNPSVTQLEVLTKRQGPRRAMARSTIQDKLRGHTAPKIEHVLALVKAFVEHAERTGVSLPPDVVDEQSWREAWEAMQRALIKPRRELAQAARAVRELAATRRANDEPGGERRSTQDDVVDVLLGKAKEEFDWGFRDAAGFARDVPWYVMEDLAHQDFDVRSWIERHSNSWGYIAAGLGPENASLPSWCTVASRYLGELANPMGFDQYSFRRTGRYVQGFGAGLRSVWEMAETVSAQAATTATNSPQRVGPSAQHGELTRSSTSPVTVAADRINDTTAE